MLSKSSIFQEEKVIKNLSMKLYDMETDCLQEHVLTEQGGMDSSWKKV